MKKLNETFMKNVEIESTLDTNILSQLEIASPISLSIETIIRGIRISFPEIEKFQIETEIHKLVQKNLIHEIKSVISRNVKRYKISCAGKQHLKKHK